MTNKKDTIILRVSTWEKRTIEEKAKKIGLSVSSYLRFLALNDLDQEVKNKN